MSNDTEDALPEDVSETPPVVEVDSPYESVAELSNLTV